MKHIPSNLSLLFGFAILEILSGHIHSALAFPRFISGEARTPTVYIAGDSLTIGGPVGTDGWGNYLAYSLDPNAIFVNNSAIAGESARRYTREGHFAAIAKVVELGDWVIIEFGHNDAGSVYPASQDNGRGDCPGAGDEICPTVYNNVTEIVQTFPTYLKAAARSYLSKGARVIIASPTPNNPWETGNFTWGAGRFAWYAWLSVQELGGPKAGVYYIPHGAYAAQALKNLGPVVADTNYPVDHGHTSPYLASIIAQAFVLGLKCGTSPFQDFVINATARIEGSIFGDLFTSKSDFADIVTLSSSFVMLGPFLVLRFVS